MSHTDRYLSARQYASKDKTTRNDKAARHSSNKPSQNCVVQQTQSTKHLAPQSQHEAQGTTHHICRRFQPSSCASPSLRKCKHEWAGLAGEGIPRRTAAADFDSKREGREGGTGCFVPVDLDNYPKIGPVSPPPRATATTDPLNPMQLLSRVSVPSAPTSISHISSLLR